MSIGAIPKLDDDDLADIHQERAGNKAGVSEEELDALKSDLLSVVNTGDVEQIFAMDTLAIGVTVRKADYPFFVGPLAAKLKLLKLWGGWKDAVDRLGKEVAPSDGGQGGRATLTQIIKALREKSGGWYFAYDKFLEVTMVWPNGEVEGRPVQDEDTTWVRLHLESAVGEASASDVRDAIKAVAKENAFDSAIDWAKSLPEWDGVSRVETFYIDTFGVPDTPYTRAVGRYRWTAAAGRLLVPGIQADMAPILVGAQGQRKTSVLRAICPNTEWYTSLDLGKSAVERARQVRGRLNVELEELAGLRYAELEGVKSFISRRDDDDRPPYERNHIKLYRRCIFEGTTNKREVLRDTTGNRRWLPMQIPEGAGKANIAALSAVRDKLWAEGVHLFQEHGVLWREAEELAEAEHGSFMPHNPDIDIVETLLDSKIYTEVGGTTYRQRGWISFAEVAEYGFELEPAQYQRNASKISEALRLAGCVKLGQKGKGANRGSRWSIPAPDPEGQEDEN
jgi:hypothetical protein